MSKEVAKNNIEKSPVTVSSKIRHILSQNKVAKIWAYEADADGNITNTQIEVYIKMANIDSIIYAAAKAAEKGDINATKFLLERGYPKEDLNKLLLQPNIKHFQIDTTLLTPEEYELLLDFELRTLGK